MRGSARFSSARSVRLRWMPSSPIAAVRSCGQRCERTLRCARFRCLYFTERDGPTSLNQSDRDSFALIRLELNALTPEEQQRAMAELDSDDDDGPEGATDHESVEVRASALGTQRAIWGTDDSHTNDTEELLKYGVTALQLAQARLLHGRPEAAPFFDTKWNLLIRL